MVGSADYGVAEAVTGRGADVRMDDPARRMPSRSSLVFSIMGGARFSTLQPAPIRQSCSAAWPSWLPSSALRSSTPIPTPHAPTHRRNRADAARATQFKGAKQPAVAAPGAARTTASRASIVASQQSVASGLSRKSCQWRAGRPLLASRARMVFDARSPATGGLPIGRISRNRARESILPSSVLPFRGLKAHGTTP
jgi:hypothetical protein